MQQNLIGLVALLSLTVLSPAPLANAQAKKDKVILGGAKSGKLARKVIVWNADAKLWTAPDPSSGEAVEPFTMYFRLYAADGAVEKNGYFRVGASNGKPLGWVKKADVLEWDTRCVLMPEPPPADAAFQVFRKKATSDADPMSDADLPKLAEAVKLVAIPAGQVAICPILQKPAKERESPYNVAFFVAKVNRSAAPVSPVLSAPVTPEKLDPRELKLEVVFVIDTTASMTPLLNSVREVVRTVVATVEERPELKGRVRLGLVEYQDAVPGSKLVASRMVSKLTGNFAEFQKSLSDLQVATEGSADIPEDVLAGLKSAISDSGWDANSSKHIVLIGDASAQLGDKEKNPRNSTGLTIKQVVELGRKRKASSGAEAALKLAALNFHAILAHQPWDDMESKEDFLIAQKHFSEIAKNNGELDGFFHLLKDANDKDERAKTTDALSKQLTSALGVLAKGIGPVDPKSPIAKSVFELTTTGAPLPMVASGWAAERDARNKLVARKGVLVTKRELVRLKSTLDFVHAQMEMRIDPADRQDLDGLVTTLKQAAATMVSGQQVTEDAKLAEFISDLPLQTEAMRLNARTLSGFNETNFREWLGKLDGTRKTVGLLIRDTSWYLQRKDSKVVEEFAFLRLDQLP